MKLHQLLFDAVVGRGVRHIFGIPGDFVLNLYEALERDGRFELVRLSHEPAVGFAADGAARITGGLGVCCVTYGAGGLNMVNSVACAYAEESPLVVLSGGPGRIEKRAGMHVHHEVKSFESQLASTRRSPSTAPILDDPRTAAAHIARALEVAREDQAPGLSRNPARHGVADIDRARRATQRRAARRRGRGGGGGGGDRRAAAAAARPVLIVGVEVHRFQLREQVVRLAERLSVPVASSFLGRGVFPTRHPQFVGTYLGVVSPPPLREIVENSDCVLLLGELISDTSLGVSADALTESNLIMCVARDVFIGHHRYQHTPLDRVVTRLLESADLPLQAHAATAPSTECRRRCSSRAGRTTPIKVRHVIKLVNEFLERHPTCRWWRTPATALFASVEIQANECVAPAYYATMGFAVPAALGAQMSSGRRPLVLVGDGAFQMTGSEISHAPRATAAIRSSCCSTTAAGRCCRRSFRTPTYNDTVAWPFAKLAELWGGRGFKAHTPRRVPRRAGGGVARSGASR